MPDLYSLGVFMRGVGDLIRGVSSSSSESDLNEVKKDVVSG